MLVRRFLRSSNIRNEIHSISSIFSDRLASSAGPVYEWPCVQRIPFLIRRRRFSTGRLHNRGSCTAPAPRGRSPERFAQDPFGNSASVLTSIWTALLLPWG